MTAIDLLAIECGPDVAWVVWMENPRSRHDNSYLGDKPAASCAKFIARQARRVPLRGAA